VVAVGDVDRRQALNALVSAPMVGSSSTTHIWWRTPSSAVTSTSALFKVAAASMASIAGASG
jgi:hypothetical protein